MPKLKLMIMGLIFTLFAVFTGLQVARSGIHGFFLGFFITLIFGLSVFLIQTLSFIAISRGAIAKGESSIEDYQSPIDIWLVSIPFCLLMIVSFIWLKWYLVQVYFCTTLALTGMLLGNGLGRGSNKWTFKKSVPFFFGVIASTLFALLMEWMV
ncbi:MAG: hypothetical protein JXQ23_12940 [Clostridia bacterium]|nr:hypothetical protein [Clostridia bacterium]